MSVEFPSLSNLPARLFPRKPGRYWEIDLLRGIAVLAMILYHFLFDLAFFSIMPVQVETGFWRYFALATASLFVLLAGLSVTISAARAEQRSGAGWPYCRLVRHGLTVFSCGLLVTLVTYLFLGDLAILFGILHLIGISILLSLLFLRFKHLNLLFGLLCIGAGQVVAGINGPLWLLWTGIHPADFASVDYTPLLPWFGVILIGLWCGRMLYPGGQRGFRSLPPAPQLAEPILFIGRHSLFIYLIHQPILVGILMAISGSWI
ncbi:DUF1624 domain-containing protein [Methanosphaerula palustris]|uniref:Heparan-alpha-glucosaminide N-acetyltransferase catalytic domain-containing protein n=1 Tax=Methanosphaerula palustris (strain ATCC BAA-1556 / DSM 19958 / E1-9c) TaxID=521011 RepID=B8GK55_METPE|nr:heparan-alpha-glucosaminide N-acetyltransferase [Methanosphaerula palustris]ACL17126.1 protein of unknown function DUF1624 [Methanosphaerula palustris E1-9c]